MSEQKYEKNQHIGRVMDYSFEPAKGKLDIKCLQLQRCGKLGCAADRFHNHWMVLTSPAGHDLWLMHGITLSADEEPNFDKELGPYFESELFAPLQRKMAIAYGSSWEEVEKVGPTATLQIAMKVAQRRTADVLELFLTSDEKLLKERNKAEESAHRVTEEMKLGKDPVEALQDALKDILGEDVEILQAGGAEQGPTKDFQQLQDDYRKGGGPTLH